MPSFTYAPNPHPYAKWLLSHSALKNWNYLPYSDENLHLVDILILISPSEFNDRFFAPDRIWKQYLQRHCPQITFFTLGIYPNVHPNYLHLFDLSQDFEAKRVKALAVTEDWEPFVYGAVDARQLLKDFLDGHGAESFLQPIARLKSILSDVKKEIGDGTSYEEIYSELIVPGDLTGWWETMLNRLNRYHDFLRELPFYNEFDIIESCIQQVQPYFEGECKDEQLLYDLKCLDQLKTIFSITEKIKEYAAQ